MRRSFLPKYYPVNEFSAMIILMKKLLLSLILMLLLSACTAAPAPMPGPATQTPTITVPPLPSLTPWSTKTPSPTHTPTSTPLACWGVSGQLVEDQIPSNLLPNPITVSIYLPPCYDEYPTVLYPSLYLFHGQGYDQTQWQRLGFTNSLEEWIARSIAPTLLIVMPYIEDWDGPEDSAFGQAVIEELIPYVEENYQIFPNRIERRIGGISRGASWALHLGLTHFDTFSAIGAHSLPVFYEDAPNLPAMLDAIPEYRMPNIYVDYAESDQSAIRHSADEFLTLLDERQIPYTFNTAPGIHDESYWASQIENYVDFYTALLSVEE